MEQEARDQALSIVREKRDLLLRERAGLRKHRATLAERDRQIDRELADCVAAARVFGTVLELPDDDEEDNPFKTLMREDFRTLFHGRGEETKKAKPPMPKVKDIVRKLKITRQIFYRWKRKYGSGLTRPESRWTSLNLENLLTTRTSSHSTGAFAMSA